MSQLDLFSAPLPVAATDTFTHHEVENNQPKKVASKKHSPQEEPTPEPNAFADDPILRKYNSISIGDGVERNGVTGIVIDKFISLGGLPHLWVCRGVSNLPYPEIPTENLQVYKACRLDEVVRQQKEAA